MTRQSMITAESWCQAGRNPERSPNFVMLLAAGRALLLALLIGWLGWTLVSALRTKAAQWTRTLDTAQVLETRSSASPMTERNIG